MYVLCPKYGKFSQPPKIPQASATCNRDRCVGRHNSSMHLDLDKECPNPLLGQIVTIAEVPAPPYFLLPQIYGIKKVSGCLVNLHFYLGEYFKYYPNIIMEGGGIGGNETTMVGKWGAVSTIPQFIRITVHI